MSSTETCQANIGMTVFIVIHGHVSRCSRAIVHCNNNNDVMKGKITS